MPLRNMFFIVNSLCKMCSSLTTSIPASEKKSLLFLGLKSIRTHPVLSVNVFKCPPYEFVF